MTDVCYPPSAELLSVEQARRHIEASISGVDEHETVYLPNALARITAELVVSPIDIPPQRNAAMDGYAFASSDIRENVPFALQLAGCSWAGQPYTGSAGPNQCVRIFTGAVVPDFADSVITQEQVQRLGDRITFPSDTRPFKNIRAAGSDVKKQDVLIAASKRLTANDLGLLAAAGIDRVRVKRRIKVAFFSTGDELMAVGQPLQSGQIYDSNRYLLAGLLNDANHSVTDLGVIKDDQQLLEKTLLDAATQFDIIISSGGASVGDADFVKQTLEKCGQINFWKLAIKPGKPLAFGKINNAWFFGLPGNPVAVLVTYHQFVQPALRQLAGACASTALQLLARCENALRKQPGRQEYQRGILSQTSPGVFSVRLAGEQDSHQLKVASLANCFIVLPAGCGSVDAGQLVTVEPFEAFI